MYLSAEWYGTEVSKAASDYIRTTVTTGRVTVYWQNRAPTVYIGEDAVKEYHRLLNSTKYYNEHLTDAQCKVLVVSAPTSISTKE